MSSIVPLQLQGEDTSSDDLENSYKQFRALVMNYANNTLSHCPQLEIIDYSVYQSHYVQRGVIPDNGQSGEIHVGLSKELVRYVTRTALGSADTALLLVVFPDLEKNQRKMAHSDAKFEPQNFGLRLTRLALQLCPKSPESWHSRRYLFNHNQIELDREKCELEFDLILEAAQKHKCNYHAWEHARYFVDNITDGTFEKVLNYGRRNITDSSAFSFILHYFKCSKIALQKSAIMALAEELIYIYPQNSILWTLRYGLISSTTSSSIRRLVDTGGHMQNLCPKAEKKLFTKLFDQTSAANNVFGKYHQIRLDYLIIDHT